MKNAIPQFELEFIWAIDDGDLEKLKALIATHPELRTSLNDGGYPRVANAVKAKQDSIFEFLLTVGYDVNAVGIPPYGTQTALQDAISSNQIARTKRLLEVGASPNVERPVIAAMKTDFPLELQIQFIELLLQFGADLNRLYSLYGDASRCFSALDWAPNKPLQEFLLQRGALAAKVIQHLLATGQAIPTGSAS